MDAKYLMLELRATDNDAKRRKLSRQIMALVRQHKPGVLSLGGNLCAQITRRVGRNFDKGVTCSWTFEYERAGRRHYLGLGSCNALDPIEAEAAARQQRKLLAEGKDPLTIRRERQAALKAEAAKTEAERAKAMTFEQCARAYISAHRAEWAGDPGVWAQTLADYVFPLIGALDVALIDTAHVMKVLTQPVTTKGQQVAFWEAKQATANRTRRRIEAVLDWATVRKFRSGDNPARWDGHIEHMVSKPKAKQKRPALPYALAPAFAAELERRGDMLSLATLFYAHGVVTTWDVLVATVADIDRKARLWKVNDPKSRGGQKGLAHVVPLSDQALAIVDRAAELRGTNEPGDLLFPNSNPTST
jgi:hypothetical protein